MKFYYLVVKIVTYLFLKVIKLYIFLKFQVNPITKRVKRETEFSGDYEENDYEYNYDEDYFHLNNILDRPVPSLATPVFPDSVASEYSEEVPSSPVFKPVPLATPVLVIIFY